MGDLKQKLKTDLKKSMKAQDKTRIDALRELLSAIQYQELQSEVLELDDRRFVDVLKREIKKKQEELEFAQKLGRPEKEAELTAHIEIFSEYLPEQLNEDQLRTIIRAVISSTPNPNIGAIMKILRDDYGGQFDNRLASTIVKEELKSQSG